MIASIRGSIIIQKLKDGIERMVRIIHHAVSMEVKMSREVLFVIGDIDTIFVEYGVEFFDFMC